MLFSEHEKAWERLPPGGNLDPLLIIENLMKQINTRLDKIKAEARSPEEAKRFREQDEELTEWYRGKAVYEKAILMKEGRWKKA